MRMRTPLSQARLLALLCDVSDDHLDPSTGTLDMMLPYLRLIWYLRSLEYSHLGCS